MVRSLILSQAPIAMPGDETEEKYQNLGGRVGKPVDATNHVSCQRAARVFPRLFVYDVLGSFLEAAAYSEKKNTILRSRNRVEPCEQSR